MGINWAEHSLEIAAPIETCFDVIVDYESFPRWQTAVSSIEVLTRREGLGERVRLFVSTKGQKVDYTLDYSYDRPTRITWDFVEGNGVKDIDGAYIFEELDDGRTRATYKLGVDPSLPIPGIVARRIHAQALKRSVEELRDEAERRHAEVRERPRGGSDPGREPEPWPAEPAEPEPMVEPAAERPSETAEPEPALGAAPSVPRTAAEGANPARRDAAEDGIRIARGAARTAMGVAGGAAALALGITRAAAGTAIGLGRDVAGTVTDRISRRLGDEPDEHDHS